METADVILAAVDVVRRAAEGGPIAAPPDRE
jgi:hypothetical protein